MPELPEVEVVRSGLQRWVVGRTVRTTTVLRDRAVRRHLGGPRDFGDRLRGGQFTSAERRGKFLWLPLRGRQEALVGHLGMSGQLVLPTPGSPTSGQLRIIIDFDDDQPPLHFIDQRTFGWLAVEELTQSTDGRLVPTSVVAIAPDPFELGFDLAATARSLRRRNAPVKSVLLDQGLVSGIGNIYADEALWRARRHWRTPARRLRQAQAVELLTHARSVMAEALAQGGTSFDSLYVNVNGESGYFSRDLDVYGREGQQCRRCDGFIVREPFANRSSYRCGRCQRSPAAA